MRACRLVHKDKETLEADLAKVQEIIDDGLFVVGSNAAKPRRRKVRTCMHVARASLQRAPQTPSCDSTQVTGDLHISPPVAESWASRFDPSGSLPCPNVHMHMQLHVCVHMRPGEAQPPVAERRLILLPLPCAPPLACAKQAWGSGNGALVSCGIYFPPDTRRALVEIRSATWAGRMSTGHAQFFVWHRHVVWLRSRFRRRRGCGFRGAHAAERRANEARVRHVRITLRMADCFIVPLHVAKSFKNSFWRASMLKGLIAPTFPEQVVVKLSA